MKTLFAFSVLGILSLGCGYFVTPKEIGARFESLPETDEGSDGSLTDERERSGWVRISSEECMSALQEVRGETGGYSQQERIYQILDTLDTSEMGPLSDLLMAKTQLDMGVQELTFWREVEVMLYYKWTSVDFVGLLDYCQERKPLNIDTVCNTVGRFSPKGVYEYVVPKAESDRPAWFNDLLGSAMRFARLRGERELLDKLNGLRQTKEVEVVVAEAEPQPDLFGDLDRSLEAGGYPDVKFMQKFNEAASIDPEGTLLYASKFDKGRRLEMEKAALSNWVLKSPKEGLKALDGLMHQGAYFGGDWLANTVRAGLEKEPSFTVNWLKENLDTEKLIATLASGAMSRIGSPELISLMKSLPRSESLDTAIFNSAKTWSRSDAEGALRWAERNLPESRLGYFHSNFVTRRLKDDPEWALRYLEERSNEAFAPELATGVMNAWPADKLDEALLWSLNLEGQGTQEAALMGLSSKVIQRGTEFAIKVADAMGSGQKRDSLYTMIVNQASSSEDWQDLIAIASKIDGDRERAHSIQRVLNQRVAYEPVETLDLAQQLINEGNEALKNSVYNFAREWSNRAPEDAFNYFEESYRSENKSAILARTAVDWMGGEFDRAFRAAQGISDEATRVAIARNLSQNQNFVYQYPEEIFAYVDSLSESAEKDQVLDRLDSTIRNLENRR